MAGITYGIRFEKLSRPIRKLGIIQKNKNYSLGEAESGYQEIIHQLGNNYQPSGNRIDFEVVIFNDDSSNTEELEIDLVYTPTKTLSELISEDIHYTIHQEKDISKQERWIQQEQEIGEQFMRERDQVIELSPTKNRFQRLQRKKESTPEVPEPKVESIEEVPEIPELKPKVSKRNINMDFEPTTLPEPQEIEEPKVEEQVKEEQVKEELVEEIQEKTLPSLMSEAEFLDIHRELQPVIESILQPITKVKEEGTQYILEHLSAEIFDSEYQLQLKKEYLSSIYDPEKINLIYDKIRIQCAEILENTSNSLLEAKKVEVDTIDYQDKLKESIVKLEENINQKCIKEKEKKKQEIETRFNQTKQELKERHDKEKTKLEERQSQEMNHLHQEQEQEWEKVKGKTEEEYQKLLEDKKEELEFVYNEKTIQEKNERSQSIKDSIVANSTQLIEGLAEDRDRNLTAYLAGYQHKIDDKKEAFEKAERKHIQEEKEREKKERREKAEAHRQRLLELKEEENRIAKMEVEKMTQKNEALTEEIKGLKAELQDTISKQQEQAELDRMKNLQYQNQVLEQQNEMKYHQMQISSNDQSKQEISKLKKMIVGISAGAVLGMGAIGFGVYGHFENKQREAESRIEQQKKEEAQKEEQQKLKSQLEEYGKQLEAISKNNDTLKKENQQKQKEVEKLQKKIKDK